MKPYYEEDVLVEKVQSGEIDMVGYVTHHSEEWDDEYREYCNQYGYDVTEESSALNFLDLKDRELQEAMDEGYL